jgi:hypothetical protein
MIKNKFTPMWGFKEVSTRNCTNTIIHDGVVTCPFNEHLKLMEQNVTRFNRLLAPCKGCADFNNDWGVK